MRFILSTNNMGKVREFGSILIPLGIEVVPAGETGLEYQSPEETGTTFEENADIKASYIYEISGQPSIADDSGLMIDALGGEPGIYSSRYAGINADDNDRINKILYELRYMKESERTARFICSICCIMPGGEKIFSRGECEGSIAFKPTGESGFGYDPIFLVDGNHTLAELTSDEKNKISHRGKALKSFYSALKGRLIWEDIN